MWCFGTAPAGFVAFVRIHAKKIADNEKFTWWSTPIDTVFCGFKPENGCFR
jgi:hypothetical protein